MRDFPTYTFDWQLKEHAHVIALLMRERLESGAWQVRRMDPAVLHPLSHAFEVTGLRVTAKAAETHLKWEGLHKVRETPDLFMFYYSPRIAYYLPKRAVGGPAEIGLLRDLVKERLPATVPYQGV